jgi:hypothetical protein
MEEVVFHRPEVFRELEKFVEARLHTDGFGEHRPISLRNQALRDELTGVVSTPVYAALDATSGDVLGIFDGATSDVAEFVAWLREVLAR